MSMAIEELIAGKHPQLISISRAIPETKIGDSELVEYAKSEMKAWAGKAVLDLADVEKYRREFTIHLAWGQSERSEDRDSDFIRGLKTMRLEILLPLINLETVEIGEIASTNNFNVSAQRVEIAFPDAVRVFIRVRFHGLIFWQRIK